MFFFLLIFVLFAQIKVEKLNARIAFTKNCCTDILDGLGSTIKLTANHIICQKIPLKFIQKGATAQTPWGSPVQRLELAALRRSSPPAACVSASVSHSGHKSLWMFKLKTTVSHCGLVLQENIYRSQSHIFLYQAVNTLFETSESVETDFLLEPGSSDHCRNSTNFTLTQPRDSTIHYLE